MIPEFPRQPHASHLCSHSRLAVSLYSVPILSQCALIMRYALSFQAFVMGLATPLPGNPNTFWFFCYRFRALRLAHTHTHTPLGSWAASPFHQHIAWLGLIIIGTTIECAPVNGQGFTVGGTRRGNGSGMYFSVLVWKNAFNGDGKREKKENESGRYDRNLINAC